MVTNNYIMKRLKTKSKHYFNDEIDYVDINEDIHLKPGVHRLSYNTHIEPDELETHINDIDLKVQKNKRKANELYTLEDGITEY